jgi:rhodanese-related sulfurtransferase
LDITTRSGADLGGHGDIDFRGAIVDNYVLHPLLAANQEVLLFDVRQPLDLLARYEIIPGAKRIPPKRVLENPSLIPKEKDSIVYCTCPSDRNQPSNFASSSRPAFLTDQIPQGWNVLVGIHAEVGVHDSGGDLRFHDVVERSGPCDAEAGLVSHQLGDGASIPLIFVLCGTETDSQTTHSARSCCLTRVYGTAAVVMRCGRYRSGISSCAIPV